MPTKLKLPILAAFVLLVAFANYRYVTTSSTPDIGRAPRTWVSKHHPVHLYLPDGWTLIRPFLDSKTAVTVGIVNATTNQSLVIKVTQDVSDELVSDDLYRDAIIQQMVAAADGNKFIDESSVVFQGAPFNKMRFLMNHQKLNRLVCQNLFVRRTGEKSIACQVNYPVKSDRDLDTPPEIDTLLERIKLFNNEK